ncbi:hypothetical protein [Methylobacterium sp. JK268]
MRARPPGWSIGRAAIAVAALYALCLQIMIGGLAPPTRVGTAPALLCGHQDGAGAPDAALPCPHPCCAAGQATPFAVPASLAYETIAWTLAAPPRPGRRGRDEPGPRPPPRRAVSPRGPPQA